MKLAASLLFGLALLGTATAQPTAHAHGAGEICTLYDAGGVARPGPAIAPSAVQMRRGAVSRTVVTRGQRATISVTYTGFTAEAQAAFQRAVDIWSDHLESPVTIRVDASFGELGERVLGSAGPRLTRFQSPQFPAPDGAVEGFWYPFALADALYGQDIFPPEDDDPNADISAVFNSGFDRFYFGTGATPANEYDFTTIVLHELGHGLGFVGSGEVDDGVSDGEGNADECGGAEGTGCWGYFGGVATGFPLIFDAFIEAGDGTEFLNTEVYPNNSVPLGDLLQSEDLFVDAATVVTVNGGERPPVWAPAPFEGGSSFSHWDEIIFTRGTSAALMTPQLSPGEQYLDPGTITCAFFYDMGWPLGDGCAFLVGIERPPPVPQVPEASFSLIVSGRDYAESGIAFDDYSLPTPGPNPFVAGTDVLLEVGTTQDVVVELFDTLGRRVQSVFTGVVAPGIVPLRVDGAGLASGVYILRATGETMAAATTLTRIRG